LCVVELVVAAWLMLQVFAAPVVDPPVSLPLAVTGCLPQRPT
jgi:hypothetical protein